MSIETLNGLSSGIYRVKTTSDEFVFDLDKSSLLRLPSSADRYPSPDGSRFTVESFSCHLGEPMSIAATDDGTGIQILFTRSFSTDVISITQEEMIPDGWDR